MADIVQLTVISRSFGFDLLTRAGFSGTILMLFDDGDQAAFEDGEFIAFGANVGFRLAARSLALVVGERKGYYVETGIQWFEGLSIRFEDSTDMLWGGARAGLHPRARAFSLTLLED